MADYKGVTTTLERHDSFNEENFRILTDPNKVNIKNIEKEPIKEFGYSNHFDFPMKISKLEKF